MVGSREAVMVVVDFEIGPVEIELDVLNIDHDHVAVEV